MSITILKNIYFFPIDKLKVVLYNACIMSLLDAIFSERLFVPKVEALSDDLGYFLSFKGLTAGKKFIIMRATEQDLVALKEQIEEVLI